jgi:YHS domain-containing protein
LIGERLHRKACSGRTLSGDESNRDSHRQITCLTNDHKPTEPTMKHLFCIFLVTFAIAAAGPLSAAETAAKPYPLNTCIVSGEKLDSMGKPYVFTKDGQEVKLCCKACLKDFNKEPAKYLKELEGKAKK